MMVPLSEHFGESAIVLPSYGREAGRPAPRHFRTRRETFTSPGSSV